MRLKSQAIGAVMALFAATASAGEPANTADEADEAIYRQRFETFLRDPGNFPYAPLEQLAGAKHYRPLPAARHHAIAEAALVAARSYAEANRSTAFLVWRSGRIESAWYGAGVTARTPLVSKSLSKPLTAIAVGRAISCLN
jgi:CubicO group peptidase (beta-lactamase class C family)